MALLYCAKCKREFYKGYELQIEDTVRGPFGFGMIVYIQTGFGPAFPYGDRIYLCEWIKSGEVFDAYFSMSEIEACFVDEYAEKGPIR